MSLPLKSVRNDSDVQGMRGLAVAGLWPGRADRQWPEPGQRTQQGEWGRDQRAGDCVWLHQVRSPGNDEMSVYTELRVCTGQATGAAPGPGGQERSPQCKVSTLPQQQVQRGQEVHPQHQEERLAVHQVGAGEREGACHHSFWFTRTLWFSESSPEWEQPTAEAGKTGWVLEHWLKLMKWRFHGLSCCYSLSRICRVGREDKHNLGKSCPEEALRLAA